jgi:hypothetical protein
MAAPTVYKATSAADLVFTLTNEADLILTNYSRNVTSAKTEVRDADNEVVAVAYSGTTAAISIDGYINGTVGVAVAGLFTLANDTSSYGLSGGTVIIDSVNESHGQGEFKKVSVSLTQYSETMTA